MENGYPWLAVIIISGAMSYCYNTKTMQIILITLASIFVYEFRI